jgi:hypothetical protein
MPAVATTNDNAPTAIGASRSACSWALIAPWIGSAAPASTASVNHPPRSRSTLASAPRSAWARTISPAPSSTAAPPSACVGRGGCVSTPSQPKPSSASDASIWPVIQSPTVTTAPRRGKSTIPEVM